LLEYCRLECAVVLILDIEIAISRHVRWALTSVDAYNNSAFVLTRTVWSETSEQWYPGKGQKKSSGLRGIVESKIQRRGGGFLMYRQG
jgi:hypothetical protein